MSVPIPGTLRRGLRHGIGDVEAGRRVIPPAITRPGAARRAGYNRGRVGEDTVDLELHELGREVAHQHGRVFLREHADRVHEGLHLPAAQHAAAGEARLRIARVEDDAHEAKEIEAHDSLLVAEPEADAGEHLRYGERGGDAGAEAEELEKGLQEVGVEGVELVCTKAREYGNGEFALQKVTFHIGGLFLQPFKGLATMQFFTNMGW